MNVGLFITTKPPTTTCFIIHFPLLTSFVYQSSHLIYELKCHETNPSSFHLSLQLRQLALTSMEFKLDSAEYCQAQHK